MANAMPLCDTGPAFILHSCPIAGDRWAHGVARAHREAHGAVVHAAVRFGRAVWVRRPPRWRRWVVCPKNPGRRPFRTGAHSLPASPGFPGSSLRPDLLALAVAVVHLGGRERGEVADDVLLVLVGRVAGRRLPIASNPDRQRPGGVIE